MLEPTSSQMPRKTPASNLTNSPSNPSHTDAFKTESKTKEVKQLTGLQHDFFILKNIDFDEDPHGAKAIKQINFNNRGSFFPNKEFDSPKQS